MARAVQKTTSSITFAGHADDVSWPSTAAAPPPLAFAVPVEPGTGGQLAIAGGGDVCTIHQAWPYPC
jgi:hypothetical protein